MSDKDGNIIFEITPHYKYHFCEPDETPSFISYEEWIKDYKPYLIRVVPRDIAHQWLNQAREILNAIDENTERERKIFENNEGKELTNEWVKILKEDYGIEDPWEAKKENKIPAEFLTDEWWKKRGL
ncbi:MAG TPA: hypothetical protein VGW78_06740 [Candidatus Babeliales bacterium]|nr:hypothetical protein [Candidatus Babeliales bacterium]